MRARAAAGEGQGAPAPARTSERAAAATRPARRPAVAPGGRPPVMVVEQEASRGAALSLVMGTRGRVRFRMDRGKTPKPSTRAYTCKYGARAGLRIHTARVELGRART